MSLAEPLQVTFQLITQLERLGVRYLVGGSIASSLHGVPRSTQDIDIVADLPGALVDRFVSAIQAEFYVDKGMVVEAIQRRASFNILHLKTMFKVDVFIFDRSPLAYAELQRAVPLQLGTQALVVCSPEDIIIQKLVWFQKGNRISERQWRDVIGVLQVQGDKLDTAYIEHWARALDVQPLWAEALAVTRA